ncbi:MAG: aminotransferase class I/II-fold pyridoxal phosphate-dependent enzyme, partial [Ilumatobacteraceae bacterium]
MAVTFSDAIEDRSARGIAAAVGRMITRGDLAVGTRLPTVRELSKSLGVSPTTVSEAWQTLTSVGAIDARGRRGTFVRQPTGPGSPRRYRRVTEGPGHFALDLSTGTPPSSLLPDLGPVVARISRQSLTSSYLDNPVLPELEARLRDGWPFRPEALTVVDGAMDALDRVAQIVVRLGDRVIVEHPTFRPLLDLLDELGAEVIGVDLDDEGPVVAQFAAALQLGPAAIFLQPRAHNPSGVTTTNRRMKALAAELRASPGAAATAIVVEDDHSGDIATGALVAMWFAMVEGNAVFWTFSKSQKIVNLQR